MPDEQTQRLNYFKHQFLTAEDFLLEQDYHLSMRRMHNRLLHSPGVASGLDVTKSPTDDTQIVVAPGTAIDGNGQEIVVRENVVVPLASHPDNTDVFVTIHYEEELTDPPPSTEVQGFTRWTERAVIGHSTSAPTGSLELVLARVHRVGKNVSSVDVSVRSLAGSVPRADQVLSRQIKEADGVTGQDTEIGSGVKTAHIQDGAVTSAKIADGTIATGDLANGAVTSAKIADGSIAGQDLSDGAVTSAKIADGSVLTQDLADGAVATQKLGDNAIGSAKLADADNATGQNTNAGVGVKTGHIADGAIVASKVADLSLTGGKIADASLGGAKLMDNSVSGVKLTDASLTGSKLADRSLGQTKHAVNSISVAELKTQAIPGYKATISLTSQVVSGLNSPAGYSFLGIGLWTRKGTFPDASFTPTALSAWSDPAMYIFNVVAVTLDPGVTVTGPIYVEFGPVQTYYYPALGSPPAPFLARQVQASARTVGLSTPSTTPPPNLTIHLNWTTVLPT